MNKMKLTLKKAFGLSIEKWEWIIDNVDLYDRIEEFLPHLADMRSQCGLCEYYQVKINRLNVSDNRGCDGCPLDECGENCFNHDSAFDRWEWNRTEAHARGVLDLIKEKYQEHLGR